MNDVEQDRDDAMLALLDACARQLLANPDGRALQDWLLRHGPVQFAQVLDTPDAPPDPAQRADLARAFFGSLALVLWASAPLPSNGFKAPGLHKPGRNEACLCGSGGKFKHCCQPLLDTMPAFDENLLAGLVIRHLPRAQWAGLRQAGARAAHVLYAADLLADEGRVDAAVCLLEPWRKLATPWPDSHAALLDLLGDLYLEQDKPRKRRQLAREMVDNGAPMVQSLGWQRLAAMAADAGHADEALAAFGHAQRLTPDAPRVALLEVTVLMGLGQPEQARARGQFHQRRLQRLPASDERDSALQTLDALLSGEHDALFQPDTEPAGPADDGPGFGLGRLLAAVQHWPPERLRLNLRHATAQDLGALQPDKTLAPALKRWRAVFPLQLDGMANTAPGGDWNAVFADDEAWTACLLQHPELADSLEVLSGVDLVLRQVPRGVADEARHQVQQRALRLWALLRAGRPQALCEWGHLDNRPALSLLVRLVHDDDSARAERCLDLLQALVLTLNPHDNHGLRDRLAAVYLRRGQAAEALALCERYPQDHVAMQLLHARSLVALQRLPQAARVLQAAVACNPHVAALLTSRRRVRPFTGSSYRVGSADEARLVVAEQHDLWGADPAVAGWVARVLAGGGGSGTPGGPDGPAAARGQVADLFGDDTGPAGR